MSAFRKFAMAAAVSGAAALTMAGGAFASTVTATLSGISGSTVSITSSDPAVSTNANAGAFSMTGGTGGIVGDFVAFCVDIVHTVTEGTTYTYEIGASRFTSDIVANVQRLFDANYASVAAGDNADKAAFQVALWDTLYENFSYSGISTDAVNAYLTAADDYSGAKQWNLSWLINGEDSNGNSPVQDLVAVAPVPLPAAGFLLLGGLAGLGITARRRKNA